MSSVRGWADPSTPGWQETLMASIAERADAYAKRTRRREAALHLYWSRPFHEMLDAAAQDRDINLSSYARRAIAKQIAADLGLEWTEVLRFASPALPYGKAGRNNLPEFDDGEGYGDWG